MCGIAGFAGKGSNEDLKRMCSRLAKRGPDAEGYWRASDRPVHFGHRRLSVLDPDGGAQPMVLPEAGLVITYNGEIYNHRELRQELESAGAVFRTHHSDTEVLLHGYRTWGTDFCERLDGMWAFVIFDPGKNLLFGSRDRFGEKPLYYSDQPGMFAFASQLDALAEHPGVSRTLWREALLKYFGHGYFPAPWTPYEGARKLPAGHSFLYDLREQRLRVFEYWDLVLDPSGSTDERALEERAEEFLSLLDRSVSERMKADVPVGLFLSGGIDSSAIAASAVRVPGAPEVRTFNIGFEEPSFDESDAARKVAEFLGTRHACEMLSREEFQRALQPAIAMLDEPLGDSSIVPTARLSEFARKSVTVALSGEGGDELFAGYDPFLALAPAKAYRSLIPRPVHEGLLAIASKLPASMRNMSWSFRVKRALSGLSFGKELWFPVWMAPLRPDEIADLCGRPQSPEELYSEAIEAWERYPHLHEVDKLIYVFTKIYFADDILAKVDRASMHASLEVRAPFLAMDMVDFARKLPWPAKLKGLNRKYILKRALAKRLPAEILERPKKGFGSPVARGFKEGGLSLPPIPSGYPTWLRKDFAAGKAEEPLYLWSEWVFRQWLREQPSQ